jgi:hypothetical protein
VYTLGRSPTKAEEALGRLRVELGGADGGELDVHFVSVDLGDLKSVRSAAEELKKPVITALQLT